MKVVIPKADDFKIHERVLESIYEQEGVDLEIIIVSRPGSNTNQLIDHRRCESSTKQECLQYIKDEEFAVMNDADNFHLRNDNLSTMLKYLKKNSEWGGVVAYWGRIPIVNMEPFHIPYRCLMMRKDAWNIVKFHIDADICTCPSVSESVRNTGFRYGYVDPIIRTCECYK